MTDIGLLPTGLIALFLLFIVTALRPSRKGNVPRVGIAPGPFSINVPAAKREFTTDGHRLVEQGYREVTAL